MYLTKFQKRALAIFILVLYWFSGRDKIIATKEAVHRPVKQKAQKRKSDLDEYMSNPNNSKNVLTKEDKERIKDAQATANAMKEQQNNCLA